MVGGPASAGRSLATGVGTAVRSGGGRYSFTTRDALFARRGLRGGGATASTSALSDALITNATGLAEGSAVERVTAGLASGTEPPPGLSFTAATIKPMASIPAKLPPTM